LTNTGLLTKIPFLGILGAFAGAKLPFPGGKTYIIRQAFGRAYGTESSQAHSPCLWHRPKLVGGAAPKPLSIFTHNLFILILSLPTVILFTYSYSIHYSYPFTYNHLFTYSYPFTWLTYSSIIILFTHSHLIY